MFTGLVENIGEILEIRRTSGGALMRIKCGLPLGEVVLGDSIACNGACLTVVAKNAAEFSVDVSEETLSRSTFATAKPGCFINLERALCLGDRLGGHLVSGHVDCRGALEERRISGEMNALRFSCDKNYMKYLAEKGSVAVDGISLTVSELHEDGFSVAAIPHTLEKTTLKKLTPKSEVNIEFDQIAKYIERLIFSDAQSKEKSGGISRELLERYGFMK